MVTQKSFNKRIFVLVGLLISASGLPLSGLFNHQLGLESLNQERLLWMAFHNVFGIMFIFFSIWHIKLNWKAFVNYFRKFREMFISKEALYAVSLILSLLMLAVLHIFHNH